MTDVLVGSLFAAGSFLLGLWGRRNLDNLVPSSLSPQTRARKQRELKRGAFTLMGFAVLLFIGVIARIVFTTLY